MSIVGIHYRAKVRGGFETELSDENPTAVGLVQDHLKKKGYRESDILELELLDVEYSDDNAD